MSAELNCIQRRALLNAKDGTPARLSEAASQMAADGFLPEAVDFYHKAGDEAGLKGLLPRMIEEGDYFLFNRINTLLGRKASPDEWDTLAGKAALLGKQTFAAKAGERAEASRAGQTG